MRKPKELPEGALESLAMGLKQAKAKAEFQSIQCLRLRASLRLSADQAHFRFPAGNAGRQLKAVQELLGHADLKMTMRYAHLSHEHLRDSVNLLNDLPSGKQMVNNGPKEKGADKLSAVNPS